MMAEKNTGSRRQLYGVKSIASFVVSKSSFYTSVMRLL